MLQLSGACPINSQKYSGSLNCSLPDPATNRPIIQLHGHVHSTPDKPWNYFDNQYDVGVDNNNFTPVNLAELLDKIHYKVHIKQCN